MWHRGHTTVVQASKRYNTGLVLRAYPVAAPSPYFFHCVPCSHLPPCHRVLPNTCPAYPAAAEPHSQSACCVPCTSSPPFHLVAMYMPMKYSKSTLPCVPCNAPPTANKPTHHCNHTLQHPVRRPEAEAWSALAGKSRRRRAYPQQIVTTRLLYCLQDPFAQLSRLQRI